MAKGTVEIESAHDPVVEAIRRHLMAAQGLWSGRDFSNAIISAARAIRVAKTQRGKTELGAAGLRALRLHLTRETRQIEDARNDMEHQDDGRPKLFVSHGGLIATAAGGTIDVSKANIVFSGDCARSLEEAFRESSTRRTGSIDHNFFENRLAKAIEMLPDDHS
ncbi:MAG: hypothetical protein LBE86_02085 [Gemmobacter sp.]|jgi:hypothetical protein|nr:hypothetical protein [Gemmobacter sp.]